ncbi:MAG: phosphatidate cytidylyltransferase [Chloroflexi bacterium]|nr:phosphatidate cytidylyltransferase [Chloroflexota bacterium]
MTPPAWLRGGVVPRFATGFAAMPLAVLAILEGGPVLAAVVAALLALAVLEFGLGMRLARTDPVLWLAAAGAVAMSAVALTDDIPTAWPFSAAVLAIVAAPVLQQLVRERGQPPDDGPDPGPFADLCRRSGVGLGALVYIGWLGSFIVLLRELPQGEEWLLLAVAAGMATDTGAFAVGKLLGRRPMAPRISPRKTIEGGIAGLLVGFAAVLLINLLPDLQVAVWKMVLLGIALPLMATAGDLAESVIKRALDVKDFSQLVPGHGGVLDRLDSLLFVVPTVYFFVQWIVL